MTRSPQDIIKDLLEWRNPYTQMDLAAHFREEITKLEGKVERTPGFAQRYEARSGQLPITILSKRERCVQLLENWKDYPENIALSDHDKTVVSDMLEFITLPFHHFGNAAAEAVGTYGGLVSVMMGGSSRDAEPLSQRIEQMAAEHRHLSELLIELCDALHYSIPPSLRMLHVSGIGTDSNSMHMD